MLIEFTRSAVRFLTTLRCIVSAGEPLYMSTVRVLRPHLNERCIIRNDYGPAECTLAATSYTITGNEHSDIISLPIGRPLANSRVYLLDEYLQLVTPGQMAEIVIGGAGVFSGYRNNDDLTRQVLIEFDGSPCYRTGDFGRLNAQSEQLEYLGRRDHQVKIRGQRIELHEIEHVVLSSHADITNCLVIKHSMTATDQLVAYVQQNSERSVAENVIRHYCQQHLPPFMIPSLFIILDKFPLTSTNKVDRRRLPQPKSIDSFKSQDSNTTEMSALEHQLSAIFMQAFELSCTSSLNIDATFAELGVTSLGIIKALSLIRQQQLAGSYRIDIHTLLSSPSVRQLARTIDLLLSNDQHQLAGKYHESTETDQQLDRAIQALARVTNKTSHTNIFLTGSTGFLGTYLLDELIKQTDANIYCLVRSSTSKRTDHPRVFYLQGDLTQPKLGINDEQYALLSSKIRSIYHCGALVNFVRPYEELRAANVLGSVEIIKLACLANARINYISTLSVKDDSSSTGYSKSKRVAERLMEQARGRGLSVGIFRPGFISWCSSTGHFNPNDWFTLLFSSLIEFGSAPEIERTFEITPVNFMSQSIVQLGESIETANTTIDLPATHKITFSAVWTEICRQRMVQPSYLSVTKWRQQLDEQIKSNPYLFYGLFLFLDSLTDILSQETTTIDVEANLNLPIFIKTLLETRTKLFN